MEKHKGEILEMAVRKGPYTVKTLANKLGISRATLYNKFRDHNVDYGFLLRVGDAICYDFKKDFPELKTTIAIPRQLGEVRRLQQSYLQLLERYDRLFSFLIKITHEYGLDAMKKQIDQLTR